MKAHAPGAIKVTLPSANQFPAIAYKKGISDAAYPTYSSFLWDIVPIIKSEVARLAAAGVSYIQIDAPRYSYYIDPKWRQHIQDEMGLDPEAALDEAIRGRQRLPRGHRPARNVTLAIHLCRGNNRSQWYAEGGYDPIAEKLFNQLNVDQFLLEYESERAGTFEPLRFVPASKAVVLGLVSTKLAALESQDLLLRRIDEASALRADRAAGPQPPMRVRVGDGRQSADRRRSVEKARARGRDGEESLGIRHRWTSVLRPSPCRCTRPPSP